MNLDALPRLALGHLPTPLEPLPRLGAAIGVPRLLVKRDDCTGLATGGNKTRKLEYLLAEARHEEADTIITAGALQSNHVRQTVAACARLGLGAEVVLVDRVDGVDRDYRRSGNRFLDHLLGAVVHEVPGDTPADQAMADVADAVRRRGGAPYIVPVGGSNALGALGYVRCALELRRQAEDRGVRIDHLVTATSSGGTQAGLVAGLAGSEARVHGMTVDRPRAEQESVVDALVEGIAERLGASLPLGAADVRVDDAYLGEGYGIPSQPMVQAVELAARLEGLLVDPVYGGKALAGLVDRARQGAFDPEESVVFLHTGGTASLFAYLGAFGGAALSQVT
ncbi:MAG: D-cysteine desulfhydrase [Sandaracinaceae bacterium]